MKRWLSNQLLSLGYRLQEPWTFPGEERMWRVVATYDDPNADCGDAAGELLEAMMAGVGAGETGSRKVSVLFTTNGLSDLRITSEAIEDDR